MYIDKVLHHIIFSYKFLCKVQACKVHRGGSVPLQWRVSSAAAAGGEGAVLLQRQCLLTCLFQTPLLSPRADAGGCPVARGIDRDQGRSMHGWLPCIFF